MLWHCIVVPWDIFWLITNCLSLSINLERPTIEIYSNKQNDRYYVGEDVTIRAIIRHPSAVLCMTWQRGPQNSSRTINTSLPKYKETQIKEDECLLEINNCHENDTGNYFILATCTNNIEDLCSNQIYLDVLEGKRKQSFLFSCN